MKPYEHLADPAAFEDSILIALDTLGELRMKLTDGLCDVLFDLLTLEPGARPRLDEMRSNSWIVSNCRR